MVGDSEAEVSEASLFTVSFEALSPGKAELETQAFCFRPYSSPTASQLETCPVLAVTVVP